MLQGHPAVLQFLHPERPPWHEPLHWNARAGIKLTAHPGLDRRRAQGHLGCVLSGGTDDCVKWPPPLPTHFPQIVKLLILTGQRRGEIAALQADHCEIKSAAEAAITLPPTLTKNKRAHCFPIGPMTRGLLFPIINQASDAMLFPARGKPERPFNGWSKGKDSLDELSGVSRWTLHDLRRTFRTNLSKLGIAPHIAERLVNHVSARSEMELVYDQHTYMGEMRNAVRRWEGYLAHLLSVQLVTE